jgi:hypothetical protein
LLFFALVLRYGRNPSLEKLRPEPVGPGVLIQPIPQWSLHMNRAFERRAQRVRDTTSHALRDSKRVIWCFEPQHMPAMIDLLIAQGSLSEADRPHCVHATIVKGEEPFSQEEIARTRDADEILEKAGIRTLTAKASDAFTQGPEAFNAFWRDLWGHEPCPEIRQMIEELERDEQKWKLREHAAAQAAAAAASPTAPLVATAACISACK